jgi:sacsin
MIHHVALQEFTFLQKLKLPLMQKSEFFHKIVVPDAQSLYKMDSQLYQQSILQMLLEFQQLLQNDSSFFQVLRVAKFIPTSADTLVSAAELFDPAEQEMINLLDERYFPCGSFRSEEVLVILRSLGLKTIIDWDGIIASARSVALVEDTNIPGKQQKGKYLLRYLDKNIDRLIGEEKKPKNSGFSLFSSITSLFVDKGPELSPEALQRYIVELRKIAWLPVMTTPIYPFMPWVEHSTPCAPPNDCVSVSDGWLCSAMRRLVQESINAENLRKILGLGGTVSDEVYVQQVTALSKAYDALALTHKQSTLVGTTSSSDLIEFRQILNGLMSQLYRKLDSSPQVDIIRTRLQDVAWIWMGQHFVSATKVAIHSSVNATPYLYPLPEELKGYQRLLSIFSIKHHFSFRDFISALGEMAIECGVSTTAIGEPLSDSLLDVAISLVNLISAENAITLQSQTIFIPDSTGRLAESVQLMNDDVPWLVGPEFIGIRASCRFIHSSISSKVAEKLGVKSLRTSLVATNVEQTLFGGLQANNFESFGQAESLTNRLKTILDLYPDGSPILNELIQNADDAGATVVRFLVDENSYGKESLMDSRMEQLQGPSLIIQNDAKFTEADFRSLASVGQGSKLEKLATTGRFGLGFNSTYHITDTPMFVSGDYFVFFDPHCAYVPGATINQPGIRIKFSNTNLKKVFPNQFQPFLQYGFDCEHPYQGTIFRFPLRTATQAKKSEICKRSYKLSDVDSIIDQLVGTLSSILLFLRSVKTIEIYRIPEGQATPLLFHSVDTTTISKITENDQSLMAYFDKTIAAPTVATYQALSKENFYNQLLSIPDERLPLTLLIKMVTVKKQSGSGVESTENREYIIVQGLRGGRAKKLACSEAARDLKLIPYGGIAACISTICSGDGGKSERLWFPCQDGQVFCFLPTPIKSTLQVHINAYWELSSNRRDIWRGEDTKGDAKLRSGNVDNFSVVVLF